MEKNICKVCGREISHIDLVACPNCDQKYHKWCWSKNLTCLNCDQSTDITPVAVKREEEDLSVREDGMFANIGAKIKGVATFSTIVGIIIGIIIFIVMLFMDSFLLGLVIGGMVAVISWVSSFLLYGFGALISSSQKTERLLREILKEMKE